MASSSGSHRPTARMKHVEPPTTKAAKRGGTTRSIHDRAKSPAGTHTTSRGGPSVGTLTAGPPAAAVHALEKDEDGMTAHTKASSGAKDVTATVAKAAYPGGTIRKVKPTSSSIFEASSPHHSIYASDFAIGLCRRHREVASDINLVYHRISRCPWRLSRQGYMAFIGAFCRRNWPNRLTRTVPRRMEEKWFEADELPTVLCSGAFVELGNDLEADEFSYGLCRAEGAVKLSEVSRKKGNAFEGDGCHGRDAKKSLQNGRIDAGDGFKLLLKMFAPIAQFGI
ncbi:hypothetical protein BHE74_00007792 [Ensete ventricosum]|nr:hypothetical protein BHE74_00007792 [Ensete ventricosum]